MYACHYFLLVFSSILLFLFFYIYFQATHFFASSTTRGGDNLSWFMDLKICVVCTIEDMVCHSFGMVTPFHLAIFQIEKNVYILITLYRLLLSRLIVAARRTSRSSDLLHRYRYNIQPNLTWMGIELIRWQINLSFKNNHSDVYPNSLT